MYCLFYIKNFAITSYNSVKTYGNYGWRWVSLDCTVHSTIVIYYSFYWWSSWNGTIWEQYRCTWPTTSQRNKYVQSHLQQAEIRCQFRPALDGSSVEGALAQCHWYFDSKKKHFQHVNSINNDPGVPKEMQKVMVKGLAKDDKSLKECGITSGSKVMVIGSTFDDVLALVRPSAQVRVPVSGSSWIITWSIDLTLTF